MLTGKQFFKSFTFRLGLMAAALLCVTGAILGVRYFAQAAPYLTSDKVDYYSGDTAIITGAGFAPSTNYAIPVIRPDGTIVKGDGSFVPGWDKVQSDASGAFTYSYQLDGVAGLYEVRAYAWPWSGDLAESPIASMTFHDGNVRINAAPDGVTFTLIATAYSTTDCSGSGSTTTYSNVDKKTVGVGSTESLRLQAAATSDQGGSFINWTSEYGFTDYGGGVICVQGFSGGGGHDYYANYGGTPTPTPTPITPTATPITPTATPITPTATPVTPTATPVPPPATPVPPTATPVPPTATPVPPTPTRTNTPVPPTPTRTNTPVPPTPTHMNTSTPCLCTVTPTPPPTSHGVGGIVLLPPAAIAAEADATAQDSGRALTAWLVFAGAVAGMLTMGSWLVRSRRSGR